MTKIKVKKYFFPHTPCKLMMRLRGGWIRWWSIFAFFLKFLFFWLWWVLFPKIFPPIFHSRHSSSVLKCSRWLKNWSDKFSSWAMGPQLGFCVSKGRLGFKGIKWFSWLSIGLQQCKCQVSSLVSQVYSVNGSNVWKSIVLGKKCWCKP